MDVKLDQVKIQRDAFSMSAHFALPKGITAIIGPSGGGKSTLLLAIAGFIDPIEGRVLFDGTPGAPYPGDRPVTMLFQDHNLFPHLTVEQNVGLGLRPNLKLTKADHEQIEHALERVELDGMGKRRPENLSGGQQQRVAIARAFVRNQPLLLLDEPFAALGPALRQEMLKLVADIRLGQGADLLLVTHTPEDARAVADHVIIVGEGMAHPPMPTKMVFDNPPEILKSYLGT